MLADEVEDYWTCGGLRELNWKDEEGKARCVCAKGFACELRPRLDQDPGLGGYRGPLAVENIE